MSGSSGNDLKSALNQRGKPFVERPATSRANARSNIVGMDGYITARVNNQNIQSEGMFGPKIPQGANYDSNLFTI